MVSRIEGAERRQHPRRTVPAAEVVGRARLLRRVSGHYPSLRPDGCYKVISRNPDALEPVAREGFLWIDVDGRPRQVWAGHFEVERAGDER